MSDGDVKAFEDQQEKWFATDPLAKVLISMPGPVRKGFVVGDEVVKGGRLLGFKGWEFDAETKRTILVAQGHSEWDLYNHWLETDGLAYAYASPRDRLKAYEASITI